MTVRNKLLQIRLQMSMDQGRDISQKEMAELLGLERSQYNRYENHLIQPSLDIALQIARILGKHVEDIFLSE